jgi:hypothetical protein
MKDKRGLAVRLGAGLLSLYFLGGSAFAWIAEVRPTWRFNHSMHFAVSSLFVGAFFAYVALRSCRTDSALMAVVKRTHLLVPHVWAAVWSLFYLGTTTLSWLFGGAMWFTIVSLCLGALYGLLAFLEFLEKRREVPADPPQPGIST